MKRLQVSVVIPVYNEQANLRKLLPLLTNTLRTAKLAYEIIIIDDHSTDGSFSYFETIANNRRIIVEEKKGTRGKAFSLQQGFTQASGEIIVMIDGDLQYPPEVIPEMIKKIHQGADIVVANRIRYNASLIRNCISKLFRYLFAWTLFGLQTDVQSGLKVFTREVLQIVRLQPTSQWTFDLEFLYRAKKIGFTIENFNITFSPRRFGKSNISFISTALEIGLNAIVVRLKYLFPEKVSIVSLDHNERTPVWRTILQTEKKTFPQLKLRLPLSTKVIFSKNKTKTLSSILNTLSMSTFLFGDIIVAFHSFSFVIFSAYFILSIVCKTIFFMTAGGLRLLPSTFATVVHPTKEKKEIISLLFITFLLSWTGFVVIGLLGDMFLPILFHTMYPTFGPYVLLLAFSVLSYTIAQVIIVYHSAKNLFLFSLVNFLLAIVEISLLRTNNIDFGSLASVVILMGMITLPNVLFLHIAVKWIEIIENNIHDLLGVFTYHESTTNTLVTKILIFNWRDSKHVWAGGAEIYLQEIAKRWVNNGNEVTIFCGNDGKNNRNDIVDGIRIIRRGGFFTVYIWACFYYIFRLRGKFDAVIDCENGIPFFTPLFVKKPIFLLIFHIHQEVFTKHLPFPFSLIARTLEAKCMPFLYKKRPIITISESTKKEILRLGMAKSGDITIVYPGVSLSQSLQSKKTVGPSLAYVGRLKPYKNIDIAIKAFADVVKQFPQATFTIAGEGESMSKLKSLVNQLQLSQQITFLGKVTEEEKQAIYRSAWVVVQPSIVEGWGITVIEANAQGTPVIASNVNGLKDSVVHEQTGLLIPAGNSKAFAEGIITIFSDKKLRTTLAQKAFVWSQRFNWDTSASQLISLVYAKLAKPYQQIDPVYTNLIYAKGEQV